MKVGIFYGSTNGNTENAAKLIRKEFGGKEGAALFNVMNLDDAAKFEEFDLIIMGTSTWGDGDLQEDWESFYDKLDGANLSGKKVALFGLGDQDGFGHVFVNAMKILYDKVKSKNIELLGDWSTEGYDFESSESVVDGKFVGLALDEDNQSDLTEERVKTWCGSLKSRLGI